MPVEDDLPVPVRNALRRAGHEPETPPTRRIFTNRDLDFDQISVVGFDMDYTLALYRQDALDALSIEVTVDKMIAAGGYPAALRERSIDPAFAVRGLVVDKEMGNLLKMDLHGYVGRAYHGTRLLPRPERKRIYRAERISEQRERFAYVDTMFALPEVAVYAALVQLIDESPELWDGSPPSYEAAWTDVRTAIDEAHRDDSIKSKIKADPGAYIKHDPDLAPMLHKLRSAGKKIFLLTNSFYPFTNAVLTHMLDGQIAAYEDWTVYFDWMIVGASKPSFFTQDAGFQELSREGKELGGLKDVPQKGKIYQGGNRLGLQSSLGVPVDAVLYVGDHIYGDIVKSKKTSGWRTALVVDDLEHDLQVRIDYAVALREIAALSSLRDQLNEEVAAQRHMQRALGQLQAGDLEGVDGDAASSMLADAQVAARRRFDRLREHAGEVYASLQHRGAEVDGAFNEYWGSVFSERQDASMFGAQLESYACLYTGRVSNFLYVSPARYFLAPHGSMPHWKR